MAQRSSSFVDHGARDASTCSVDVRARLHPQARGIPMATTRACETRADRWHSPTQTRTIASVNNRARPLPAKGPRHSTLRSLISMGDWNKPTDANTPLMV